MNKKIHAIGEKNNLFNPNTGCNGNFFLKPKENFNIIYNKGECQEYRVNNDMNSIMRPPSTSWTAPFTYGYNSMAIANKDMPYFHNDYRQNYQTDYNTTNNINNKFINLSPTNSLTTFEEEQNKIDQHYYQQNTLSPIENYQKYGFDNQYPSSLTTYCGTPQLTFDGSHISNMNINPVTPKTKFIPTVPLTPPRNKKLFQKSLSPCYLSKNYVSHKDIVHRFRNSKYMQNLNNHNNDDTVDGFIIWKKADDVLLNYLRMEEGLSWKSIATFFPGRTVSACQCRLKRLKKKQDKSKNTT